MNHYETLGIGKDADDAAIKKAYRQMTKKHHPDRPHGDHEKMLAVRKAYDTLSDAEKRTRYDQTGEDGAQRSLYDEAQNMLAEMFVQYLEKGGDENPLPHMRRGLQETVRDETKQIADIEKKLAKIEKRRGVIKRKGKGFDLFDGVVQQRVNNIKAGIDKGKEHIEAVKKVLQMLDEYECFIVDVPKDPMAAMHEELSRQLFQQSKSFTDIFKSK